MRGNLLACSAAVWQPLIGSVSATTNKSRENIVPLPAVSPRRARLIEATPNMRCRQQEGL
jgi:hypothetical protein